MKRTRLFDSDDEELNLENKYDEWNKAKKELATTMQTLMQQNYCVLGIGAPMRTPSYILGRPTPDPTNINREYFSDALSAGTGSIHELSYSQRPLS